MEKRYDKFAFDPTKRTNKQLAARNKKLGLPFTKIQTVRTKADVTPIPDMPIFKFLAL